MDDETLVRRCQAGDREAFAVLFGRHGELAVPHCGPPRPQDCRPGADSPRPVAEVAEIMGAPAGSVKVWLRRARSALSAQLKSAGGGTFDG